MEYIADNKRKEKTMFVKTVSIKQAHRISVVHLATASHDTLEYISSDSAIKKKCIDVREVSETGMVNAIEVVNNSDQFIFMMDGDVLVGAKQTRMLNTSIFFAPKSRTVIPVSCVERGRWQFVSRSFSGSHFASPSILRVSNSREVTSSLRNEGAFTTHQSRVWENVQSFVHQSKTTSRTHSLADIYEQKHDDLESVTQQFDPADEANGFAVFVDNRLLNIDLFNRRDIYREYFKKVIHGIAAETLFLIDKGKSITESEVKYRALDVLDSVEKIEGSEHPGVALGIERRFESKEVTGFHLQYDDLLVHLAVLSISTASQS